MQAPAKPSLIKQSSLRVAYLFRPIKEAGRAIWKQKHKLVLVRMPRNTRKAPRRPIHVPPFQVDVRGAELRRAMSIAKMVAQGVLETPEKPIKEKPELSRRQVRADFIRESQLDAQLVKAAKREHQELKRIAMQRVPFAFEGRDAVL